MAEADLELDKENTQSMQRAIPLKFDSQSAIELAKSHISIGTKFVIPQLLPKKNTSYPATAEQMQHNRAAAAHNELLLNAIRAKQSEARDASVSSKGSMLTASGDPPEEPHLQIPLDTLLKQNNTVELTQMVKGVVNLKIIADDAGGITNTLRSTQEIQVPKTIDLTTTLIARQKDAPPREAASKVRHKQESAVVKHFDIPFISCDRPINMIYKKRQSSISSDLDQSVTRVIEKSSVVGSMMDATVGYPRPRKTQLKYAASTYELQNLKLYKREDYGANIKRFRFDTPSPDDIVKAALLKSLRISRT